MRKHYLTATGFACCLFAASYLLPSSQPTDAARNDVVSAKASETTSDETPTTGSNDALLTYSATRIDEVQSDPPQQSNDPTETAVEDAVTTISPNTSSTTEIEPTATTEPTMTPATASSDGLPEESAAVRTSTAPYTMVEIEKVLSIKPQNTRRYGAGTRDVHRVLLSTARELWRYFPDKHLDPINVKLQGGPIVYYDRESDGTYNMALNVEKTYWAQYAYQFAHEFTHILCHYKKDRRQQKWFEESICELASIFAIRGMVDSWQTDPPYDHWRDFSESLRDYFSDLIDEGRLPEDQTFVQWFAEHRDHLAENATDRPLNKIIACQLYPLFKESPEQWRAVWYLNDGHLSKDADFEQYLKVWLESTPEEHKDFIRKIAQTFNISLNE